VEVNVTMYALQLRIIKVLSFYFTSSRQIFLLLNESKTKSVFEAEMFKSPHVDDKSHVWSLSLWLAEDFWKPTQLYIQD